MMRIATKTHDTRSRAGSVPIEVGQTLEESYSFMGKRKLLSPMSSIRCLETIQTKVAEVNEMMSKIDFDGIDKLVTRSQSIQPRSPVRQEISRGIPEKSKINDEVDYRRTAYKQPSPKHIASSSSHKRLVEPARMPQPMSRDPITVKVYEDSYTYPYNLPVPPPAPRRGRKPRDLTRRPMMMPMMDQPTGYSNQDGYDTELRRDPKLPSEIATFPYHKMPPVPRALPRRPVGRPPGRTNRAKQMPPYPWSPPRYDDRPITAESLYETAPRRYYARAPEEHYLNMPVTNKSSYYEPPRMERSAPPRDLEVARKGPEKRTTDHLDARDKANLRSDEESSSVAAKRGGKKLGGPKAPIEASASDRCEESPEPDTLARGAKREQLSAASTPSRGQRSNKKVTRPGSESKILHDTVHSDRSVEES